MKTKNPKSVYFSAKVIVLALLMLGVMALLAFSALGENEDNATAALPAVSVEIASPIQKKIVEWDEFSGRFEATDRVEVRARVGGYIEKVNFTDGQTVNKGDVLFVIDQRPFKIALEEARSTYNQALANQQEAADNFERVQSLRETGAVSVEEYSRRRQSLAAANARLRASRTAIDNARLNLEFTEVKAPISGRVGRDLVNAGNLVGGGTETSTLLTTIVATNPIHFYFTASESDFLKYSRLALSGQRGSSREKANPVEVRLADEQDFEHKGYMDFVNNELNRGTGTIEARAIFDNEDGLLEPGMFGRARIQGRSDYEVTLVPDRLINTNQTVKFVYTVDKDSIVRATQVELGGLYENGLRIIKSGLSPEDRLVTTNIQKIAPELKVAIGQSLGSKESSVTLNE